MIFSINHWKSENGARIYFSKRNELPIVDIAVVFAAGSAYDQDQFGISNLVNHMLNQGTNNFNDEQIADGFEKKGAQFHATSDRDKSLITLRSLSQPKYLDSALKIFIDILSSPTFEQQAFLRAQKLIQNAIYHQAQTPEAIAKNALYAANYGQHPYAHPVLGTYEHLAALTIADLKQFYEKYYVANNATIIVVGDLTQKKAASIAKKIASSLKAGEAAPHLPTATAPTSRIHHHIVFPSEQTHIILGQVGIHYLDPNYFNILISNDILGGAPLISRLFKKIREQHGLAYSATSFLAPLKAHGLWGVVLQTRQAKTSEALKLTNDLLYQFIKRGPTASELFKAKQMVINNFPLTIARNNDIMHHLLKIGFYQLPNDYLSVFIDKINKVDLTQIRRTLAKSYLDQPATILVGMPDQK